jgi:hypothetical protein
MYATRTAKASIAAVGLISALTYAAVPQPAMNIELGLWEVSAQGQLSGAPAIPDSVMQRLTPEQQAKMQQMMAKRSHPTKFKECMTPEKRAQGFGSKDEDSDKCKTTVTTNTATEFAAERQCTREGGESTDTKVHFNITSKHQVSGTMDIAVTHEDGKVTNVHSAIEAQWLGSECGDVKSIEMEN